MKKIFKVLFFASLVMFVNNTFAQKFAHVNRDEVLSIMPEVKSASETLETFVKELQSQLEETQVEINKKLAAFEKVAETLSEEMKNAKFKEMQEMHTRFQEQQEAAEKDLGKKREELFTPIFKRASEIIQKISKEEGYIYVFDVNAAHYIDETQSTNLLPAIKKELGL